MSSNLLKELEVHRAGSQKGKMDVQWGWARTNWNSQACVRSPQGWTETHVSSCCLWCCWHGYHTEAGALGHRAKHTPCQESEKLKEDLEKDAGSTTWTAVKQQCVSYKLFTTSLPPYQSCTRIFFAAYLNQKCTGKEILWNLVQPSQHTAKPSQIHSL